MVSSAGSNTKFSDLVERWRPLVEKYFPPELVDKALYVIQYESGGNPRAEGDSGAARGLFQIQDSRNFPNRPNSDYLDDPENNIKYAAQQLGAASGKWTDWGEGSSYNGQPFGALGHHPYPGTRSSMFNPNMKLDTSQISDERGSAYKRMSAGSIPMPLVGDTKNKSDIFATLGTTLSGALGKVGRYQKTAADNQKATLNANKEEPFSPTGDFASDAAGYFGRAQRAYEKLHKYQSDSSGDLIIDEKNGVVLKITGYDEKGAAIHVVDTVGSKLLQSALNNTDALDRLYAAKKAGLFDAGNDAAKAYLTSEKDKAIEATRKYEDYNKRITDLIALDNLPISRAASLASTLASVNSTNAKRESRYSPKVDYKPSSVMDMSPFAQAIKNTIPETAPSPYTIDPAAFAPPKSNSAGGVPAATPARVGVPIPPPDQVLADAGIVPANGQVPGTPPAAQASRTPRLPWGPDTDPRVRDLGRNPW